MSKGLIHLYIGDGKGKTTAAIGLAVRAAGRERKVVLAQFLKGRKTGEAAMLEGLGVSVIRSEKNRKFYCNMNDDERVGFREEQVRLLEEAKEAVFGGTQVDLLVLDEAVDTLDLNMLDEGALKDFIMQKPEDMELVITGRSAPPWLIEMADYITEMKKHKHPYDRGIDAREGIEF
ncbi:MAG: cob(I)yrinic acid a,c-diamide adenosyltransferase [Clostridiales bacterium]|nr:cob(I)yrinic acid a,c-diamide adenosyltransferase [Clostridiales bacterium]